MQLKIFHWQTFVIRTCINTLMDVVEVIILLQYCALLVVKGLKLNVLFYCGFSGNCARNFTCKCDTDQEEEVKPERQAAIFAKEFQDKLLEALFNKKDDDDSPTNIPTTTPGTSYNHTNCSSEAQVGSQKRRTESYIIIIIIIII